MSDHRTARARSLRGARGAALACALALPLGAAGAASAQTTGELQVTANVAGSLPGGEYGATSGQRAGHAGAGFGLGLDFAFGLMREISWLTTLGVTVHQPQHSLLDGRDVAYDDGVFYLAMPLLTGPRFNLDLGSGVGRRVFGAVQAGVVWVDGPAEHDLDEANPDPETRYGYTITPNLGFAGTAGFGFSRRFSLALRYVLAPNATFVANTSFDGADPVDVEHTRTIGFGEIVLGYRIR